MSPEKNRAAKFGGTEAALVSITSDQMVFPPPQSVKGRVLGAFLRHQPLTHLDCWLRFGSARLAHHVYSLRKDGWPVKIIEEEVKTSDADRTATIGIYWLDDVVIDEAGERGRLYAEETARIEVERKAR